jgi:glucosamine--fructose-6-phosphate aminotransferase (isomerizing)
MAEQPAVLRALLARREEVAATVRRVVAGLGAPGLQGVVLLARGSSDNVAVHARYLLEAATGRPVGLVAPSLHTHYGAQVDYSGRLVIAISQSGATPEITAVVTALRRAGAVALAVTNDGASPLAAAADGVVELGAGPEVAVPATKTVAAQFAAGLLVARALAPGRTPFTDDDLDALPGAVAEVLADTSPVAPVAQRLAAARTVVAVGRGYLFPAALETALKIRESAGIPAEGWSSADLRHGPVAALDAATAVLALAVPGPVAADVDDLVAALVARGLDPVRIGTGAGPGGLVLPAVVEALAVVPAVVRGQQLALATALARGSDPDAPFGLTKVTPT